MFECRIEEYSDAICTPDDGMLGMNRARGGRNVLRDYWISVFREIDLVYLIKSF